MTVDASPPEPLQVTIKEAARLLAFGQSTIREKIKAGELEATGHGRGFRVTMASIKAYIERNRRG